MISPQLNLRLARERADELRRAEGPQASANRRAQPRTRIASDRIVKLRLGAPGDEFPLARLAALDSSEPLAQPVLLADVDGYLLAALALTDGAVVADPFHPTADLVQLLRARAWQLDWSSRRRRRWRLHSWSTPRVASESSR
jgi:hypothetical protein